MLRRGGASVAPAPAAARGGSPSACARARGAVALAPPSGATSAASCSPT